MAGLFAVIITTDKNLPFQQNLAKRKLAAIILPSNRVRLLRPLMSEIASAIESIREGEAVEVKMPLVPR
jgi:hypothetical protein